MKRIVLVMMVVCHFQSNILALPQDNYSHVRRQMPQQERKPVVGSEMPSAILSNPSLADEQSKPMPLFGDRIAHVKRTVQNDRQVVGVAVNERTARKMHKGVVASDVNNLMVGDVADDRHPMRLPLVHTAQRRVSNGPRPNEFNTVAAALKSKRSVDNGVAVESLKAVEDTAIAEDSKDLEQSNTFGIGIYNGYGGWNGGWGGPYGGWNGGWGGPYGGWNGGYGGWNGGYGGPYGGWGGWGGWGRPW